MVARLPFLYVASGRRKVITYRKVSAADRRYPCGRTFHESWEGAHAALVEQAQEEHARAQRDAKRARAAEASAARALLKLQSMAAEPGNGECNA